MTDENTDVGGQENDTNSTGENQSTGAGDAEAKATLLTDGDTPTEGEGESAENKAGDGAEGEGGSESEGEGGTPDPINYEFTMPEGVELDKGLADAATPVLQKYGVSQEDAQALVDAMVSSQNAGAESAQQAAQEAFNDQLEKWATELKTDADVGGDAFEENTGIARRAIDKFGSDELREIMDTTGIGNNPAMFKFALAVGKHLVEDQPGSASGAPRKETSREERLYPNMTANKGA